MLPNHEALAVGILNHTAIMPYRFFNATLALKNTVDLQGFLDEMELLLLNLYAALMPYRSKP
jgi:hypothetical protein